MSWRGIDIRRGVRVAFECLIVVKKKDASVIFKTHTENLCVGGVCVILKRGLKKNIPVEVELFLPDDPISVKSAGRVIWANRRSEFAKKKPTQFDTGIEFVGIADDDKARLKNIVDELLQY